VPGCYGLRMQPTKRARSFLEGARADAATLHQSIECGAMLDETRMLPALEQSGARAHELARALQRHAQGADATVRAKLTAAAAHAEAVAKNAQTGRARPMLDEAQKLAHRISEAVAHVRANGGSGALR
jgi:hypothetical protein